MLLCDTMSSRQEPLVLFGRDDECAGYCHHLFFREWLSCVADVAYVGRSVLTSRACVKKDTENEQMNKEMKKTWRNNTDLHRFYDRWPDSDHKTVFFLKKKKKNLKNACTSKRAPCQRQTKGTATQDGRSVLKKVSQQRSITRPSTPHTARWHTEKNTRTSAKDMWDMNVAVMPEICQNPVTWGNAWKKKNEQWFWVWFRTWWNMSRQK